MVSDYPSSGQPTSDNPTSGATCGFTSAGPSRRARSSSSDADPPFTHADGTSGTSGTSSFHPRDTHPCKVVTCGNAWSPMCPPCQPDLVPLVPLNPVSAGQTFHTTPRVGSTLVPPAWNEVEPAPRRGSTLVPFPPVSAGQTFHPGSIGKDPSRHVGGRGADAPRHKKRGPPTTTASPSNATNDPRLPTTRPLREPPTRAPRAP